MASAPTAAATSTVNRVVVFLGAATLLGMALIGGLALTSHEVPDVLGNITIAAGAGLVGLLANPRSVDPDVEQNAGYQAAVADVVSLDQPPTGRHFAEPAVPPPTGGGAGQLAPPPGAAPWPPPGGAVP